MDDTGKNVLAENIVSFEYDYKNNALNNVLGFNKLLDYSKTISLNNNQKSTKISAIKYLDEDQVTSSIKIIASKYKYDFAGYPTEIVSESPIFGTNDSSHLKSLLFYD